MKAILGISAFYHDSAAALVIDGEIVAAAQEERFTRKKHDDSVPENAIDYCLREAGLNRTQLDYVVFYEKPFVKFERMLISAMSTFPRSSAVFRESMQRWMKGAMRWVEPIGTIFLFLAGMYIVYYWLTIGGLLGR